MAYNNDKMEFAQWVRDYQAFLYRAAWALTGERGAAQDLVQETFTLAWGARRQLRDSGAVQAWLYRILRREAARLWREREPWDAWDDARCDEVEGEPFVPDARIDLLDALQALSPIHREILVLYYLSDLDYGGIAVALGIPNGTVMSRLNRARQALRAWMERED